MANEIKDLQKFIHAVKNEVSKNFNFCFPLVESKSVFEIVLSQRIYEIKNDKIIEKDYILRWIK